MTDDSTTGVSLQHLGAGRGEQLVRIAEAGLVRQGRVFLLSFHAIRTEMGRRWPSRSEIVWQTFERDLTRAMPAPDQFVLIDETTILAAIISTDAYSGQVRCSQVLREVLAFFLGRNQDSDVSMSRVSDLSPHSVLADPIDLTLPPPPMPDAGKLAPPVPPEQWKPPLSSRSARFSFISERDGPVDIELSVTPVWRLDCRSVSAYSIRRRLPRPLSGFTDKDNEAIDLCVVDFLTPLLLDYQREGGMFAVLCPFTFSTLSGRTSRLRLLQHCSGVMHVMRSAVVLEIDGLLRGSPDGRVQETLAMCRPLARVRTVLVTDRSAAEVLSRHHGADGVGIDAAGFTERQLHAVVVAARQRTNNVVVHDVPRTWDMDELRRVGVTHVTEEGRAQDPSQLTFAA